ncbi:50S ribosomal protein L25/general stress protein Ctc [Uruburuella suis]|jgi:large subunit ribosomal protein L25|uniref:Large ribosomal subunit protein bL25 n=1 Tax=Uruburuella suis TaxID=252130 RepID=A0AAE9GYW7_9NEIS|nr:50S ribosomal protein L25/general stress protein Ctc [Uruburuella suis]MBP6393060.1 50S ribosomal protein L25/general stress protein Ctc [Neisseria sp.]MBP7258779.1 50S ribosomal protein L25/general stress protein Ctc [Neisseria sp.]MBP7969045.1 50S ribosomal protein L25/general stress protein Ctc [Neisseria sp.]MBP8025429.1 50S ribosomal protein L25/general stress protein Ctc [Neisseria sp.]MBP8875186.1 50S ribosomal protein L25/general stress protein Ctc [Neisseria sp.]
MSYEIQATVREAQGTGASRRLRREGQTPAVLYGEGQEPVAIAVDHKTVFYAIEKESFHTELIKLTLNGKTQDVIVRDFQMHPFRQEVQHIDFQAVEADKPLKIRVPLHVINAENSQAVKLQGGRVSMLNASVEVIALPKNVPAALDLDCGKVVAGDILHLSDIKFPEGVESVSLKRGSNLAVATVTGKKR